MANELVLNEARIITGNYFKARRIELKYSQDDLAKKINVSRATINRMEKGLFWVGLKQYLLICEALYLFPAIAELESNTPIAEALRQNWQPNEKAMSIADAIAAKNNSSNQNNTP